MLEPFDFDPIYRPAKPSRRLRRSANGFTPAWRPPLWRTGRLGRVTDAASRLLAPLGRGLRSLLAAVKPAALALGLRLLIPLVLGLLAAFYYWTLPRPLWSAWPILALLAAPHAASSLVHLIGSGLLPPGLPSFERTAAQWLLARVRLSPERGLTVAELERGNKRSFYHPASRTIVLEDAARDERTPRAYAIAAHELGHALLHLSLPRLAALQLRCRGAYPLVFRAGMLAMLGAALTGASVWWSVALIALLAATAMQLLEVLDEAAASALALRELAPISSPSARSQMRRMLGVALASYAANAVAAALPLLLWPALTHSFAGGGLLAPGAALSGGALAFARGCAVLTLAALFGATLLPLLPRRDRELTGRTHRRVVLLAWLAIGLGLLAAPLLVATAAPSSAALAASWALLLAMWPAYGLYATPVKMIATVASTYLPDLALPAAPQLPTAAPRDGLRRLSLAYFVERDGRKASDERGPRGALRFFALAAPLAVLTLMM